MSRVEEKLVPPWFVEFDEREAETPTAAEEEDEEVVLATPSSLNPDVQWYEDRSIT